jgi:glycosyltransferase involved in cell wall biosynthesis
MLRPTPFLKLTSLWRSADRALASESWDAVMGFGRTGGHQLFRAGGGSHVTALRREHPLRRWISPADWLEMAIDRRAVREAKICIANSALGARGLREDYLARHVEVVYNGVDLSRFTPDLDMRAALRAQHNVQGPLAVFVGTGFHRKGLQDAIDALPDGWTLWVVGAGSPTTTRPDVLFLGPRREPEAYLQAADVLILPTRYDAAANATIECLIQPYYPTVAVTRPS